MANFTPNQNDYKNLTPFKTWLKYQINTWGLNSFPFVESDFDDLTNYAMMMKLMKHFNVLIENQNMVEEDMTNLYNAFTELQTYLFDEFADYKSELNASFDEYKNQVDGEIEEFETDITADFNELHDFVDNYFDNNFPQLVSDKLDEMAQDGTLENLLNDVAHLTKSYNTYTDMIADSATFTNGLRLKTFGYYSINDGGGAEYYINNSVIATNYQVDLQNGLYLNLIIKDNTINFLSIGGTKNGINDSIINKIIPNLESYKIFIPEGTYLFDYEIKFVNECHLIMDKNTILKANSTMDYLISVRRENTSSTYSPNSYIDGGILDCDNKASYGFVSYKCNPFIMTNTIIYNPITYGIVTRPFNMTPDGNHRFINVKLEKTDDVEDTPTYPNTTGIYDVGFDNYFENIVVCNFKYGIVSNSGRFNNGSCWIRSKSLLQDSLAFKSQGYDIFISNWAIDTYRYGFKIDAPGHSLIANNILWITNDIVYTDELKALYPRIIFDEIYDDRVFKVCGLKLIENQYISFASGKLPSSSFINIFTPTNLNTSSITNFRNDNLYLDNIKNFFRVETGQLTLDENIDYDHLDDGVYIYSANTSSAGTGTNPPLINGYGNLVQISSGGSQNVKIQALFIANTPQIVYRVRFANSWRAWHTLT